MSIHLPTKLHYGRVLLIALSLLLAMSIANTCHAYANSVIINDQSGVLNISKVRSDATQLPVSVSIYTTKTFTGDQTALDSDARSRLSGTNTVDIEIDTVQRHLAIESGSQVKLSDNQASNAVDAFKSNFNNGDYTGATIAAIDSVHDALTGGSSNGGITTVGTIVGSILVVVLLIILVLVIIGFARSRRGGGPPTGGGRRWGNQTYYPYPVYTNNPGINNPGSSSGAGSSFGGGFGGGAGGSFGGGGSTGGGAGGSF